MVAFFFPSSSSRILPGLLLTLTVVVAAHDGAQLRFNSEGKFKIVQFADLHYGENEAGLWGPEQDRKSTIVMEKVLEYEKPDLVVFSGDQLTGNNMDRNASDYWGIVVQPCVNANVPWVALFGNHDDAPLESSRHQRSLLSVTTREELMAFDMSHSLSYSQAGPTELHGVSNYHLGLFPPTPTVLSEFGSSSLNLSSGESNDVDELPAMTFFFMDSGGGSYEEMIAQDQIDWLLKTSSQILDETTVVGNAVMPALMFVHIPVEEYETALQQGESSGACDGGMADNAVTPPEEDAGLFAALTSEGMKQEIRGVFTGHDHGNDWCCPYKGVQLCFGRHSGYGGYGSWDRGARVIELSLPAHQQGAQGAAAAAITGSSSSEGGGGGGVATSSNSSSSAVSGGDVHHVAVRTWVRMEDSSVIHESEF